MVDVHLSCYCFGGVNGIYMVYNHHHLAPSGLRSQHFGFQIPRFPNPNKSSTLAQGTIFLQSRYLNSNRKNHHWGNEVPSVPSSFLKRLSGWWFQPTHLENMSQNGFIFPNLRGENKKYLKPPPSSQI